MHMKKMNAPLLRFHKNGKCSVISPLTNIDFIIYISCKIKLILLLPLALRSGVGDILTIPSSLGNSVPASTQSIPGATFVRVGT